MQRFDTRASRRAEGRADVVGAAHVVQQHADRQLPDVLIGGGLPCGSIRKTVQDHIVVEMVSLSGNDLTIEQVGAVARGNEKVRISEAAIGAMRRSRAVVEKLA